MIVGALAAMVILAYVACSKGEQGSEQYWASKVQEGLSMKTMLIDHLITLIYTAAFLVAGIGSVAITAPQVGLIVLAYIIVFSLEGLGVFSSKIVTEQ